MQFRRVVSIPLSYIDIYLLEARTTYHRILNAMN